MSWLVYYAFTDKDGAFTLQNFVTLVNDPTLRRSVDHHLHPRHQHEPDLLRGRRADGLAGGAHRHAAAPHRAPLVTASFVTPPFLGAIAWELLAAPNSGLLNKLYRVLTGAPMDEHLFNIYSLPG